MLTFGLCFGCSDPGDGGGNSNASDGDAGDVASDADEGQTQECVDCEGEDCEEGYSDVRIVEHSFGWQTETDQGDPIVSSTIEVVNDGDATTEELDCVLEVVDQDGEELDTSDYRNDVIGNTLDPGQQEEFYGNSGGLDDDDFPTAIATCSAENERCDLIDDENEVEEQVRR
ncbi:MAG: hypothetical protein ACOCV2_03860 [Persicimonas sp.]